MEVYITNTKNTLVQIDHVIRGNNKKPNRSLMPEIRNICTMMLKELKDELGKRGLVKKGNKLEVKNRLLHAYNNGISPINEEDLVKAKLLLRKHYKIKKVSLQPDVEGRHSKMANIMNEDGYTKSVENQSLMHYHFSFMFQLKNQKPETEIPKEE